VTRLPRLPLQSGDAFLLPKSSADTEHLWIIVTEVDAVNSKAVCVNVTTRRPHSDLTAILKVGDHPFIKHESVINYQDAREMPIDVVEQALATGTTQFVCIQLDPASEDLLKRVRQGLIDSKLTPKGIKAHCRKLWGID
jgi:hypothetical protein